MKKENTILESAGDLKAEFTAATFLENGMSYRNLLFRPTGSFKRRSHTDVEAIGEQEIGNFQGLVIDTNRSGIYDYLPEQLFHIPTPKSGKTLKKKIDDIRQEREREQKTRLFFLPLEQEFFLGKVRIGQIEQRANQLDPESLLLDELRSFWQIPAFVPVSIVSRLLPLLPQMAECRADFRKSEMILSTVLWLDVSIETNFDFSPIIVDGAEIGAGYLGSDFLTGGALESYLPVLDINIALKNSSDLEEYLTDPNTGRLIDWLISRLLPVEYDYQINVSAPSDGIFLSTENDTNTNRLGLTSYLVI